MTTYYVKGTSKKPYFVSGLIFYLAAALSKCSRKQVRTAGAKLRGTHRHCAKFQKRFFRGCLKQWIFIISTALLSTSCRTWSRADIAVVNAFNEGNTFQEKGDYKSAAAAYREALAVKPRMTAASYNLAITLARSRQYDESIRILNELRRRNPESLKVIRTSGWVLFKSQELKKALSHYFEALAVLETDAEALKSIVEIYKQLQQFDDAVKYQKELLQVEDTDENHLILAELYAMNGYVQEAIYEYEWGFTKSIPKPEALLSAGEMLEKLGLYSRAAKYYQRASRDGSSAGAAASFRLARLQLLEFTDFEIGIDSLRAAYQKGFNDDEAIHNLLLDIPPELIPVIQELISSEEAS